MVRDATTKQRLQLLLTQIDSLTASGGLRWERQVGSAHRYARWNNNLLILGPSAPLAGKHVARYLFITPFDSPSCIEINSDDADFGSEIMKLVGDVETVSRNEPPTDPFAITGDVLKRLIS